MTFPKSYIKIQPDCLRTIQLNYPKTKSEQFIQSLYISVNGDLGNFRDIDKLTAYYFDLYPARRVCLYPLAQLTGPRW